MSLCFNLLYVKILPLYSSIKKYWILAITCLALSRSALAGETFTFAAEDSWPPFAMADGSGLSRNIIERALSYSGSSATFITVPYARALKMAENGQVDGAFNVTLQKNTLQRFVFGSEPLFQVKASFYYPKGSTFNYASVDKFPGGINIALITGYEYGDSYEAHRKRFKEVRVASQRQIINMLRENKVHMAIMFDAVASYTLAAMQLPQDAIRKGELNHISDIYVAFSPKAENLEAKIALFDEGLRQLKQENNIRQ
jgi:polar amino acid transport system substrate-binding protein|tara:strand:+ start:709 stop:1476 length:768 start_codon:yes stop_codon:yes gene_type:complete